MGDGGLVVFNPKRHEHQLFYTEGLGAYKCRGCRGGGGNTGYKCRWCPEFLLHNFCGASDDEIVHTYFPQDPFKFRTTTRLRHDCDACGVLIRGFLFQSRKDLRIHPLCLTLPLHFWHSGHSGHADHVLRLINEEGGKYRCTWCKKENTNWKYRCGELACPSTLDMNCAIIDWYGLYPHGIAQVYKPSKIRHALSMVVATAGAAVSTPLVGVAGTAAIMP